MTKIFNLHIPTNLKCLVFISVLLAGVVACSDDIFNRKYYETSHDNGNVLIYVPSVKGVANATRVDPDQSDNAERLAEGTFKTLLLLAYPDDGSETRCIPLNEPVAATAEYSQYRITLDPGKYRIYFVANLDAYTDVTISKSTPEDELRELILHYDADKLPNLEDGLPMAAFPEDILEHEGGMVNVQPVRGATITAQMNFLCSKVRLTLFFNSDSADDYSYAGFGTSRPVFANCDIANVADATIIDAECEPDHDYFAASGVIKRMQYPAELATEDDVRAYKHENLNKMKESQETATASRMAWRTTLYLPENLSSAADKATTLYLNASLEGNGRNFRYKVYLPGLTDSGSGVAASPLQRSTYHDLTACVKGPGNDFEINAIAMPWTVNTLVHELHGPYHLRVEKTQNVPVTAGEETHLWYSSDVPVHFESQKEMVNGSEMNVLIIDKMINHENDSIVISANPNLPIDFDLSESYFYIYAGNIKKKIQVWPFKIKPFFNVTPQYTAVEVREMIESASNTLNLPIHFTTNLDKVTVRLVDGWDEEETMPLEFKITGEASAQQEGLITYENNLARDGYNLVSMNGFVSGNSYWTERHNLTLEYTAYNHDGTIFGSPKLVEIEIFPKRFTYRIYFRPEGDNWANPHIYIYQILALPFTLDKNLVKDGYKDRAGRPVGGHLFSDKIAPTGLNDWEGGLQYSYSGKISFRGWNTQGGPACNDPYEAALFNPKTEAKGFFVFGTEYGIGKASDKTGYGVKYIPPSDRESWSVNGGSEAAIRQRYDIDTDLMASHRAKLSEQCPLCVSSTKYNMKFPGICMLKSQKYPGWWYVDLTEVADPGKTLIMFHDGHSGMDSAGEIQVPGAFEPGIPLFDFADNEGWLYYSKGTTARFVDDKPSSAGSYKENTYRVFLDGQWDSNINIKLRNAANNTLQSYILQTDGASSFKNYNSAFKYAEFKLSSTLADRYIVMDVIYPNGVTVTQSAPLSAFTNVGGVYCYTLRDNPADSHGGLPVSNDTQGKRFRLYWPHSDNVTGLNTWLMGANTSFVLNNYDNDKAAYNPSINYISGSKTINTIKFDYLEFHLPDDPTIAGGWQMHTTSGTYRNPINLTFSSFTNSEGDGIYSFFRERPDKKFRIYWPAEGSDNGSTFKTYAWIYGYDNSPSSQGKWVPEDYSSTPAQLSVDGVVYNYVEFYDLNYSLPDTLNGNAGIIIKSVIGWSGGYQSKDMKFCRNNFKYNASRDANELFVKTSLDGFQ